MALPGPEAAMKAKKIVLGVLLAIIGLPVLLVLVVVVSVAVLDRTNGTIVSSGKPCSYLLHVPQSYDRAKPTPLVISALIHTLEAAYNIDPTRIFANGLSAGGGMAFVLSCTLSDRIAGVGLVAAAQPMDWSWCTDQRPVPVIAFHGAADPIVPYQGGPLGDPFSPVTVMFPAVRDWVAGWARRNRCGTKPVESGVAPDVTRIEYTRCAGDATVVLYTIQGGGHSWPGGKPLPEWWVGTHQPQHRRHESDVDVLS